MRIDYHSLGIALVVTMVAIVSYLFIMAGVYTIHASLQGMVIR